MMHASLTLEGSILLLERLWDQLESTVSALRMGDEQPRSVWVARARLDVYKTRMRELVGTLRARAVHGLPLAARSQLMDAMCEVSELLDLLGDQQDGRCVAILHQAQDAIVASLHEMRLMAHTEARQSAEAVGRP